MAGLARKLPPEPPSPEVVAVVRSSARTATPWIIGFFVTGMFLTVAGVYQWGPFASLTLWERVLPGLILFGAAIGVVVWVLMIVMRAARRYARQPS